MRLRAGRPQAAAGGSDSACALSIPAVVGAHRTRLIRVSDDPAPRPSHPRPGSSSESATNRLLVRIFVRSGSSAAARACRLHEYGGAGVGPMGRNGGAGTSEQRRPKGGSGTAEQRRAADKSVLGSKPHFARFLLFAPLQYPRP